MSYPKIFRKFRKFWLEIVLISLALIIVIISTSLYLMASKKGLDSRNDDSYVTFETQERFTDIYVDLSGAVKKPGLYKASNTDRLKNIIEKAGGLTDEADKDFFSINYNLAGRLVDEQKIYIPTVWEVNNGYIIDKSTQTNQSLSTNNSNSRIDIISINEATLEELDTLPGVGMITAQKIIDNRPYGALQELLDKKILGKSIFENIEILIGI